MSNKTLPAGVEIQIEIRISEGETLCEQGILLIGETNEAKDFELVGIAAQRGVYELLQSLWHRYHLGFTGSDSTH